MTYSALWLPDAIRGMGVEVVEVDGWQDRGHGDVDPQVFVSHHTADGPNGAVNSLGVVINGASYTASGPLANILQSREPGEGNDRAYIVAAGTSYNAGTGGWNGVSGNVHTIGNEIEHTGTAPLPQHRVETACKIAAGCLKAMGQPAENHCHHWEWSYPPGSKIDVCCQDDGQKCSGDDWRALTAQYMRGGAPMPAPPSGLLWRLRQGEHMLFKCVDCPEKDRWLFASNGRIRAIPVTLAITLLQGSGRFLVDPPNGLPVIEIGVASDHGIAALADTMGWDRTGIG